MSIAEANAYIKHHIQLKAPEIAEALYTSQRKVLNARPSILDLSKSALAVNLKSESIREKENYENIYRKLEAVLADNFSSRMFTSLEAASDKLGTNLLSAPVYINGGPTNRFIIAGSFEGIRKVVTTKISRDPRLISSRFGQETLLNDKGEQYTKSRIDIGHISTKDNSNLTSPLEEKLLAIESASTSEISTLAGFALEELYNIQAGFSYSFNNTAPEAINTAKKILGEGYVVLTLHSSSKNREFSLEESAIFRNLLQDIALSLKIEDIPGSNTIVEDIAEGITSILRTSKSSLKSHSTVKNKLPISTKNIKIKVSSTKLPPIRNIQGQFYSLASLESLIKLHLQDVVSANMGNGGSKDRLNYRTGRLVASAKLDHLTQSKEGMISAFYTYMRNPYGTFSDGGLQQYPKSRDPKLLIGGAIKEIMTTKVSNRMRAVLI